MSEKARQVHNLVVRLTEARKQRNFSQQYVADKIGKQRPTISLWENGHVSPQLDDLEAYAAAIEVRIKFWIG